MRAWNVALRVAASLSVARVSTQGKAPPIASVSTHFSKCLVERPFRGMGLIIPTTLTAIQNPIAPSFQALHSGLKKAKSIWKAKH